MTILQVTHRFLPEHVGGISVYTLNLISELSKGHQVFVFSGTHGPGLEDYEKDEDYQGIKIRKTFCGCQSIKPHLISTFGNKSLVDKFETYIKEIRPDIVHIQHGDDLPLGIISVSKKYGIPVVVGLHDYTFLCSTEYLIDSEGKLCNKAIADAQCLKCIIPNPFSKMSIIFPQKLLSGFARFYYSFALGDIEKYKSYTLKEINAFRYRVNNLHKYLLQADMIVTPSKSLKNRAIKWGIPEHKIVDIVSGVSIKNRFSNYKATNGKVIFGFTGRIVPIKGIHILVKAFNKLNTNDAELKIYGSADAKYLNQIKELFHGNDGITYYGRYEPNQLYEILSGIDVLVVPSICFENMPTVALEALSYGIPVIGSNVGGLGELIENGKNGFLFKMEDDQELYERMKSIIEKPDILSELSSNAKNIKSIEDFAMDMENIYFSLKK